MTLLLTTSFATGMIGGAVGGAAGAMWVVETMAKPQFAPRVKNAVLEYDMPAQGARPVDIAGVMKVGTPLHPCLIGFLEEKRELLPNADWTAVRLNPYFKIEGDIITEMAFARGVSAITRGNEITVGVPNVFARWTPDWELLMFHELVHVDQYASGTMDLPDYTASAVQAYTRGREARENDYELEADEKSEKLKKAWKKSSHRIECHPDVKMVDGKVFPPRFPSERPVIKYAIFDRETQQYQVVENLSRQKRHTTPMLKATREAIKQALSENEPGYGSPNRVKEETKSGE